MQNALAAAQPTALKLWRHPGYYNSVIITSIIMTHQITLSQMSQYNVVCLRVSVATVNPAKMAESNGTDKVTTY